MCSIGVIVKVLKGSDMMESIPELSSYLKRLKMRDSWKFVRVHGKLDIQRMIRRI